MNDLADDPKLTAFALDELSAEERAELEAELGADPDLLAEVDAIQALAGQLEGELSQEPCPELDELSRARIERRARGQSSGRVSAAQGGRGFFRVPPPKWIAAAAVVGLTAGLGFLQLRGALTGAIGPSADRIDGAVLGAATGDEDSAKYDPAWSSAPAEAEFKRALELRGTPEPQVLYSGAVLELSADPDAVREAHARLGTFSLEQPPRGPRHQGLPENPFRTVAASPLSTFGSDVDTAAYAAVRNYLRRHTKPPVSAVRLEELVNYFDYGDAPPAENADTPFAVTSELATCPWEPKHQLLRVAVKGKEIEREARPPSNLVFLLDVSGSMSAPNKLPLLKRAFTQLVEQLDERDRVAIVVYAGASGVVLPSTAGDHHERILGALDRLQAGGGTNGAGGIELAYQVAVGGFVEGGANRVILATDGDFNIGASSSAALDALIRAKAKSGVFLSVLGFGMNPADHRLEQLADKGNGSYAFIDSDREAHKVLVEQMSGTLLSIAKDLKLQVEFNPARVGSYRLLGYENRVMAARDFNDDAKDAGDVGAGHTVTAFYELVPADGKPGDVDPLQFQRPTGEQALAAVKVRFKRPEAEKSELRQVAVPGQPKRYAEASEAFRFGSAVLTFGLVLRESEHKGQASLPLARELAQGALGADPQGRRAELVELIGQAERLLGRR